MIVKLNNISISAISTAIPKQQFEIKDLCPSYSTEEIKRLVSVTGIESVRIAPKDLCTSDLCLEAAKLLLLELGVSPSDIDGIVFVSQTPDYIMPATSLILQAKLNLRKDIVAFDINYGCSAYVYGLLQASLLVSSSSCKKVLVCVGDVISKYVNPRDKSLIVIFGDAGSATLVEKGNHSIAFNIMSEGSGAQYLVIKAGSNRYPKNKDTCIERIDEDGNWHTDENLYMDGIQLMNFCLSNVPATINDLLRFVGWAKEEIGFFGLHQANKFLVNSIRKRIGVKEECVPITMQNTGNTGPASLPLLLSIEHERLNRENRLEKSILSGFGSGLSCGAVACNLAESKIFSPLEI